MKENGESENGIPAFVLKISRKLRDRYLSGPAAGKVTFRVCVCVSGLFSDRILSRFVQVE